MSNNAFEKSLNLKKEMSDIRFLVNNINQIETLSADKIYALQNLCNHEVVITLLDSNTIRILFKESQNVFSMTKMLNGNWELDKDFIFEGNSFQSHKLLLNMLKMTINSDSKGTISVNEIGLPIKENLIN